MVIENLEAIGFGQLMICMWRMLALFLCLIHTIIGEQIQDLQFPVCVKENSICIPQNYSKLDLPNKDLTTIILGIDIKDIPKIDYIDFSVTLSAYLRIRWTEPRIIIDDQRIYSIFGQEIGNSIEDVKSISVDVSFIDKLWLPDLEILALKDFENKEVLSKLEGLWLKKYKHQFWIYYVLGAEITFNCPMEFTNFPLDNQFCLFQVRIYCDI